MIDPRINFRNRDLMERQAFQKFRVRTADSIRIGEFFCQLSIEEVQELPIFPALSLLVQKVNQDSTISPSTWPTVLWGSIMTTSVFLLTVPTATTDVVSQSRDPPPIAEFNLEFGEIEASRNFLNRITVLYVIPHSPSPWIHELQRLLDP